MTWPLTSTYWFSYDVALNKHRYI